MFTRLSIELDKHVKPSILQALFEITLWKQLKIDTNSGLFFLAPAILLIPALMTFAVIPFGSSINLFGREIALQVADVNVGILYVLALTSISVYGIVLAGWSSNNKYSLLGGLRSSAQLISYELAMGLAVVSIILLAGSLRLNDIILNTRVLNDWLI